MIWWRRNRDFPVWLRGRKINISTWTITFTFVCVRVCLFINTLHSSLRSGNWHFMCFTSIRSLCENVEAEIVWNSLSVNSDMKLVYFISGMSFTVQLNTFDSHSRWPPENSSFDFHFQSLIKHFFNNRWVCFYGSSIPKHQGCEERERKKSELR